MRYASCRNFEKPMSQIIELLRRSGWNLALLLTLATLAAALQISSNERLKGVRQSHREAAGQLADIRGKLLRARDENQGILRSYARYQELEARGYIGNEHRAEWIGQIDKIKAGRKLLDIQYELAPQQLLAVNTSDKSAGFEFFASNMKLQMPLLHEEDLLNFFSDLRNNVQAYIRIRSCNVERLNHPVKESGNLAQLMAECSVDWVTLREERATQP